NEPAPNNPNEPINPPAQEISKPAVEFVKDSNNDAMLNAKEATGNTTEVKFTVPSDAVIGHTLVITVAQPGKEKYTEEIEITQELKANGIVKTVEVSEGELTQASAVIRDKGSNLSEPGADEVTVDTVSPIATPKVEFIKDINDNGVLDKTENSADTTEVKFTVPDDAEIGDFLVITIAEPGKDKFTQEFEITQDLKTNGIVKSVTVKEGEDTQASAIIRDKAGNISPSGFDHVTLEKTTPPGTTDDDGKVVVTVEAGEVKKVTTDDSSKFADQMGLNAKFYLVVNGEESITHNGWENYGTEFNSVEEANSYADQKPHDAEYKVKKIDFKTELGEGKDLVQNTDSLDSSNLKTFLGDNATDLKLVDGGEFVNKPDTQAVRAMSKISGFVYLEGGKQYKFKAASDDGLEVVINNKKLFENHESLGKNHKVESAVDDTFTPVEQSGFYKIDITHYDIGYGQALLQIYTVENGKDVALGDHENGGIALFNNTDGIRYENGKFVKDFYEVPLSGELHEQDTNNPTIKPNAEVILSKVTQDGSKAEIGKSVVGEDGTYSFNYESADKPKEGDTFVVDYRDEKGKIVATDMDSVDADDIKNISSNEVQGASSEDSGVANGEQADTNEPTPSNPSNPLSKSDDSLNFENVSNGKINSDKEPKADDKSAEIKPVNLSANDILDASKGSETILKDGKEDKVDGSIASNSASELNSDTTNDVTPSTFKIDMDNEINNVI
ncbi:hypothetical protein, partial [Campylobacter sp.]|uniref:hypothetical protein n=1 Tax=Campylobacter sp. TaxID=205 RepID=UPI00270AB804|nr:hypothetical protein [Campylobacter sp.]